MSEIKVSPQVYQQVHQLQGKGQVKAQDLQALRQTMEVDGLDAEEQQVLNHLENKTAFKMTDGIRHSHVEPNQLQFPQPLPAVALTGQSLGAKANGVPLTLGSPQGAPQGYASEKDAIAALYQQEGLLNTPDLAVVQDAKGQYFLYDVQSHSLTGDDLSGYREMRKASITPNLPGGAKLVAMASDNQHLRFYGAEASPQNYPQVQGPAAGDSLDDIDRKAQAALDRLAQMEQDLAQAGDHRGMFVTMFRTIAQKAVQDMHQYQAQGNNTAAMLNGKIALDTAVKFFEAYDNYAAGQMNQVPEAWRQAFDAGRLIEANGSLQTNSAEILGLSLNAHLLHDLPLTLQQIQFDPNNPVEVQAYNDFNKVIVQEKDKALIRVAKHYGINDMAVLNFGFEGLARIASPLFGGKIADAGSWTGVAAIRHGARILAANQTPAQIHETTTTLADTLRSVTPGGN